MARHRPSVVCLVAVALAMQPAAAAVLTGGPKADTLTGTSGNDTLTGNDGDDVLAGEAAGNGTIVSLVLATTAAPDAANQSVKANATSAPAALSADGTRLLFRSGARNLGPFDTSAPGLGLVLYLKDLTNGSVALVSASHADPAVAANGTVGDGAVFSPDGTKVVLATNSTTIVPQVTAGTVHHIVVRDLATGATDLVSAAAPVAQVEDPANASASGPAFSPDGQRVVFSTAATNLGGGLAGSDVFIKDLVSRSVTLVSARPDGLGNLDMGTGGSFGGRFTPDGQSVVFFSFSDEFDPVPNGKSDIFLRTFGDPGTLTDDTLVHLSTAAPDPVTQQQAPANDDSFNPRVLPDGRILFLSHASNLGPDADSALDLFMKDPVTGAVTLLSSGPGGAPTDGDVTDYGVSTDGTKVVFLSTSTQLGPDADTKPDVFVKDLTTGAVTLVSAGLPDVAGNRVKANGGSGFHAVSGDGTTVAFQTSATNLLASDTDAVFDVYVAGLPQAEVGGADVVDGGPGADRLRGGPGNDSLEGGPDGDVLDGGAGDDALGGGAGADVARYPGPRKRYLLSLQPDGSRAVTDHAGGPGGGQGTDLLTSMETLSIDGVAWPLDPADDNKPPVAAAGPFAATLDPGQSVTVLLATDPEGEALTSTVAAQPVLGAVTDIGGGTVTYTAAADALPGVDTVPVTVTDPWKGSVQVTLSLTVNGVPAGSDGPDVLQGFDGDEAIHGEGGDDTLSGAGGDDLLDGGTGNDQLAGGPGKDTLDGGPGKDTMDGGTGDDLYLVDDVDDVVIEAPDAGRDTVVATIAYVLPANVEDLTLTGPAVLGTGNGLANTIVGTGLADTLRGLGGTDTLTGGGGDDLLEGGEGADAIDGGPGLDTLSFASNPVGVVADLAAIKTVSGKKTLIAGGDHIGLVSPSLVASVENLLGSPRADTLKGDARGNRISGGAGNDVIEGRAGRDTLAGGAGRDIFVFATPPGTASVDAITDFLPADDTLRLSRSEFGQLSRGTLPARAFRVGRAARDRSDRIIHDRVSGTLFYDRDGTGPAARVPFARVKPGLRLTRADVVVY